jgi:hypothetical protein
MAYPDAATVLKSCISQTSSPNRQAIATLSLLGERATRMGFVDLPWHRVAKRFYTSWQSVYRAVQWVVEYGLEYRRFDNVSSIGVDEIQYLKGHKYLTVVYQFASGCRRLLWVW